MRTIEISEKTFKQLQDRGGIIINDPNSGERTWIVRSHVFEPDTDETSITDEKMLDKEYYNRAILLGLLKMGGKGKRSELLKRVEKELSHLHSRKDLEKYAGGGIRWHNRVAAQRRVLISSGLMEPETLNGIWKLTEKGREEARKLKNKQETD